MNDKLPIYERDRTITGDWYGILACEWSEYGSEESQHRIIAQQMIFARF